MMNRGFSIRRFILLLVVGLYAVLLAVACASPQVSNDSAAAGSTSSSSQDAQVTDDGAPDAGAATGESQVEASSTESAGGSGFAPAAGASWSLETDCGICHTNEAESMTGDFPAAVHASQNLDCANCHNDETALAAAHEKGGTTMPKKLKATEVSASVCEACHSLADLATKTETSMVLTDSNGTVVNPHNLPDVADHADIACGNCHQMHSDRPIDRTAGAVCSSCHHAGVYECHTCHE